MGRIPSGTGETRRLPHTKPSGLMGSKWRLGVGAVGCVSPRFSVDGSLGLRFGVFRGLHVCVFDESRTMLLFA